MQRLLLFFTMFLATAMGVKAAPTTWTDGTNTVEYEVNGNEAKIKAGNAGAVAAFLASADASAVINSNATTLKLEAGTPGNPGTLNSADFQALNSTNYSGLASFTKFELMGEVNMSPTNALSEMRLANVKEIKVKGAEVKAGTDTWDIFQDAGSKTENVATIDVKEPGALTAALAAFAAIDAAAVDCQVLHISGLDNNHQSDNLTAEDLSALGNVNVETLDLQDLTTGSTGYSFVNNYVKRVILPDGWTKAQVKAFGEAQTSSNFECCLSQSTNVDNDGNSSMDAYVKKCGTLFECVDHITYHGYNDGDGNNGTISKLGVINNSTFSMGKLKYVSISGFPSARDYVNGKQDFATADGHYGENVAADETKYTENSGMGGTTRTNVGPYNLVGALQGVNAIRLDLEDAVIPEQYNIDLTFSWVKSVGTATKEINFPNSPEVVTIPADCFSSGSFNHLEEICIPGYIKYIRTRAFYSSTQVLRHVWTTSTKTLAEGEVDHTVYDNGTYLVSDPDNVDHYGHAPLTSTIWNCAGEGTGTGTPRYGTITLPAGLELIESNSFSARSVKDVYVLNVHAPECHVDAFSTIMYFGNNTVDPTAIDEEGMITRDAYAQDAVNGEFYAMLHYPRECGTPDIQRYTDVTREYSVATTLRDGKGNVIYFPNMSEFNRAYLQGTTGYLWEAWDTERIPDMGNNGDANSFKNQHVNGLTGHTTEAQTLGNTHYNENNMTDPDKTDRSFYDVRLDADGQPTLAKPTDLKWYYDQTRNGKQLYPEMEYTNTTEYIGQQQKMDAQGHLLYVQGDCNYVQDYEFVKQSDGELVWELNVTPNDNGNYVRDYEYQQNANGEFYHPLVGGATDASPQPWYQRTLSYEECDQSVATHAGPNGNTGWLITIEQWGNGSGYPWALNTVKFYREVASYQQVDYSNGSYYVSENFARWSDTATDYFSNINGTRYNRVYKDNYRTYNSATDDGEPRYDVTDNGMRAYAGASDDAAGYQRYHKSYIPYTYREFDSSKDDANETRYCPDMEDVYKINRGDAHDYRGWHQFTLAAYATMSDEPFTPVKFYQNDNDWWTVCLPYDLKYNDMILFFGNQQTGDIPYLSKLMYVVRDYDLEQITLMFSNNLMVYKEDITGDNVHGDIDNTTKYTAAELADNPVILHKGVPYLIRPNLANNANRSFDVYLSSTDDLYQRLIDAQNVGGGALETYIYKGEYTVPAYVVGTTTESTTGSKTLQMWGTSGDAVTFGGYSKTYTSGNITYKGETVSAQLSDQFTYTFVGSFFLSLMPQYSYFLGWDSENNRAGFWYNRTPDYVNYTWNNQTGIICPNFDVQNTLIDPATGLNDPARWSFRNLANDDLIGVSYPANGYTWDFGGAAPSESTGIEEVATTTTTTVNNGVVYTINGQMVRTDGSLQGLSKGIYIVNGKKYVVK
ncbi:MAG: hypothetical protein IKX22_06305 [Prevotella sp.]|nr:hypothetical protein [Prevotella sp.]